MNLNFNVGGLNMFGEGASGALLWLRQLVHAALTPLRLRPVSVAHGAEVSLVRPVARLWRQRDG